MNLSHRKDVLLPMGTVLERSSSALNYQELELDQARVHTPPIPF